METNRRTGSWLGRLPCRSKLKLRKRKCRYKWLIRPLIHRNAIASLDWIGKSAPVPLRYLERERTEGRKREVLHLFRWYTHTRFFTQTLWHTDAFTHKHFYTETLLHTNISTQKHFYTQTLLHTEAFTYRPFYTQTSLHRNAFTHSSSRSSSRSSCCCCCCCCCCCMFFYIFFKAKKMSNRWCLRVFWRVSEQKTP